MAKTDISEAYLDVVQRFLGNERPMRFTEPVKTGFLQRMINAMS
jgi:septum site-determining protein MinD